ncbi:AraC family transcriptional regulator [Halosquirtibacter laminarini]|uniref:AraC family transcriptional regulator n=1 Tax=Halosquirtibacter laminarini TaxID=3374600 RepID=A0AC61NHT2_9BACT|nr:AraC family transcriptional regulator [Prolixibacteraceae bacterium]
MMKKCTNSRYHESINKTIDYIQIHIRQPIDLKSLAEVANISEYHFHRIFKAFIGESLGSYILRVRIESAAGYLRVSNHTLTEIAEKVGYNNQQALSKAFKRHFGVTPTAFRNIETFFNSKREVKKPCNILHPTIRHEKKISLVYLRIIDQYGAPEAYKQAWGRLGSYMHSNHLFNQRTEAIGLSFDDPNITKGEQCRFYACYSIEESVEMEGEIGTYALDEGKFAVFTLHGSYNQIAQMYHDIYYGWLPQSGVTLRDSVSYEKYLNHPDRVKKEELLTEIYIPIQ